MKFHVAHDKMLCYNLILSETFSDIHSFIGMGRFPSGQWGQTVNLLQFASVVRIHLCPL